MEVEGAWPMAIKIPSRGSSDVVPSLLLATITFSTWFPPLTSLTSEFQITFNPWCIHPFGFRASRHNCRICKILGSSCHNFERFFGNIDAFRVLFHKFYPEGNRMIAHFLHKLGALNSGKSRIVI